MDALGAEPRASRPSRNFSIEWILEAAASRIPPSAAGGEGEGAGVNTHQSHGSEWRPQPGRMDLLCRAEGALSPEWWTSKGLSCLL